MELFGVRLDMVGVYSTVLKLVCVIPTRHVLRKSDTLNAPEASSSAFVSVVKGYCPLRKVVGRKWHQSRLKGQSIAII